MHRSSETPVKQRERETLVRTFCWGEKSPTCIIINRLTVPPRRTRAATRPRSAVTKDRPVINVKLWLAVVLVERIAHGAAVVADQLLAIVALGEFGLIAKAVFAGGVFANVVLKENIKDAVLLLQEEEEEKG
jgi:hypothetical protein